MKEREYMQTQLMWVMGGRTSMGGKKKKERDRQKEKKSSTYTLGRGRRVIPSLSFSFFFPVFTILVVMLTLHRYDKAV
jgi:hypothetical protein